MLRTLQSFALLLLTTACISNSRPAGTLFSSQPPGARLVVDGRDAGMVTPCYVDLADGDRHRISLELTGYEPALLKLGPDKRTWWITWAKGNAAWGGGFLFPLFLPAGDLFFPYRSDKGPRPERVHIHLQPEELE